MGSLTMRAPAPAAGSSTEADARAPPRAADAGGGAAAAAAASGGGRLMMLHEWSYEAQTRFLKELERVEPPPLPRTIVPQRADLLRLYAAFLRTPHFAHWWDRRRQRADAAL